MLANTQEKCTNSSL